MRFALPLLLLAGTFPLAAQTPVDRFRSFRKMPPEIVMRDAAHLDPEHVRAEIDNESTRVLRITLEAGRTIPEHDDRGGVLVCLTECHLRFMAEGAPQDVHLRAGQTRWMKAEQRSMRNIGSGLAEMLYIESKAQE